MTTCHCGNEGCTWPDSMNKAIEDARVDELREAARHFLQADVLTTEAQYEFASWLMARASEKRKKR